MTEKSIVEILTEPLDPLRAISSVSAPGHGAVDMFIGAVRDNHAGKSVTGITYDVHEALARKRLHEICREASGLWTEAHCYVAHYHGELAIGGISVLIAVGSPHRAESFEACRYIIEEIKKSVPIWKQEHYTDGRSDWLPGHSLKGEADPEICCGKCYGGCLEKRRA